jgi:HSP20 family molecular chaperone IbpA
MSDKAMTKSEMRRAGVLRPAVDVLESDDGLVLLADLPGVGEEGLDIRIDNQMLTLNGRRELPGGSEFLEYQRRFQVPRDIDSSAINAVLENGVLRVTLPKAEAYKPRRIPVSMG